MGKVSNYNADMWLHEKRKEAKRCPECQQPSHIPVVADDSRELSEGDKFYLWNKGQIREASRGTTKKWYCDECHLSYS